MSAIGLTVRRSAAEMPRNERFQAAGWADSPGSAESSVESGEAEGIDTDAPIDTWAGRESSEAELTRRRGSVRDESVNCLHCGGPLRTEPKRARRYCSASCRVMACRARQRSRTEFSSESAESVAAPLLPAPSPFSPANGFQFTNNLAPSLEPGALASSSEKTPIVTGDPTEVLLADPGVVPAQDGQRLAAREWLEVPASTLAGSPIVAAAAHWRDRSQAHSCLGGKPSDVGRPPAEVAREIGEREPHLLELISASTEARSGRARSGHKAKDATPCGAVLRAAPGDDAGTAHRLMALCLPAATVLHESRNQDHNGKNREDLEHSSGISPHGPEDRNRHEPKDDNKRSKPRTRLPHGDSVTRATKKDFWQ